ncbi:hypothetical protein FPOAC2_03809 [Fusarium poae]|uniref:hypothetical protein n=1 Tax=Fusarium poae TaxID=36050 RepID=UPI001CEB5A09|nr:hypothetical protein FPOAC1_003704 [Fusarium poae]KAG8677677.1 hypothetical protein FPOAC1_003704 [Fusarium poae]
MRYWLLSLFAFLATQAVADDLSDFSNDLATDVGPLLVLFGESMTRQYLSESTSFLDYFIFAMAPIGIITAIISAIRVCGHSTLRAFIGRSQEGDGVVEAELCTSTSRDVCELFNKGGITRVLGRPQILELIHIKNPGQKDDLHLFRHYLEEHKDPDTSEWTKFERCIPGMGDLSNGSSSSHIQFAPKPNLSLNVGIKRRPKWVFVVIAILGCLLQGGVVALAGVGVWIFGWNLSDSGSSASTNYAPIMFITGTVVMCGGMFWCAALIGQTTKEVRYSRKSGKPQSRLLWLQPGLQVIGDQSFDAFAHLENTDEEPLQVWTSSRKDFDERFEVYTFFAVAAVLLGYISQFIGLRGMKAWVSLAQLGITVTMSIFRGLLRVQRLGRDANKLAKVPDMIAGHELDWLAFELALGSSVGDTSFFITGQYNNINLSDKDSLCGSKATNPHENQIDFDKVLHIRQKLAYLTGLDFIGSNKEVQQWEPSQVKAREPAQKLVAAICKVTESLFHKKFMKDKITVQIQIAASTGIDDKHDEQMINIVLKPPDRFQTKWSVDSSLLETIVGLSTWSLISAKALHDTDLTGNTISLLNEVKWKRIVFGLSDERYSYLSRKPTNAEPPIDGSIWFGPDAGRLYYYHDRIGAERNYLHNLVHFQRGSLNLRNSLHSSVLTALTTYLHFWEQLCGWNTVHESLQSRLIPGLPTNTDTNDTTLRVVLTEVEDSVTEICVQDIFLAILSPLVCMLVTGETVILESGGHVLLQNSTVTAISDILVENGLATRFGALSCAVSLLAPRLHPDPDTLVSGLTEKAGIYRRNTEWDRAETLLQWACTKFSAESIDSDELTTSTDALRRFLTALQATGELYRWSCAQNSNEERLEFGLQGIKWMITNFNHLSIRSPDVKEVLESYEHVAYLFQQGATTHQFPQHLSTRTDTMTQHPLVEAIRDGNRKMALWHLCFTATGDFDLHQLRPALPLAALNGWTEIVNAILEMNGDLDSKDEDGRTSISYCAESGHLSLLKRFVALGASVDAEDNHGRTPLLFAVKFKRDAAAEVFLQSRWINHNRKDDDGMTALHWAIRNGLMGTTHLLLDLEARLEPDARVGHGSLILEAAKTGNKTILEALLQRNISIETRDSPHFRRPLIEAVYQSETTAVQLLLMCNALVDSPDDGLSERSLLTAVENGDEAITTLLLGYTDTLEAYPNIWSSLLIAIASGYWTCAQLLLQKYVATTSTSTRDSIMLPIPAASPQKAVLDAILKIQDKQDADSNLLVETFGVEGSVVKLLIEMGAELEERNRFWETPLIAAVKKQQVGIIKAILTHGADLEATDLKERNALFFAREAGDEDITLLLLERNENADLKDRQLSSSRYTDRNQEALRKSFVNDAIDYEKRAKLKVRD